MLPRPSLGDMAEIILNFTVTKSIDSHFLKAEGVWYDKEHFHRLWDLPSKQHAENSRLYFMASTPADSKSVLGTKNPCAWHSVPFVSA